MIKILLTTIAAVLGVATIAWFANFMIYGDASTKAIDQKILKDADGNYYKLEQHIGKTFTIEVIEAKEIF